MLMRFTRRPYPEAEDVYVTGTFDDWGQTEKLNRVGETFEKEVNLPDASVKILYKVCQRNMSEIGLYRRKVA